MDEIFFILLGISLVLAIPILAVAGFVIARSARAEVRALELRVARAEAALASGRRPDLSTPAPEAAVETPPEPDRPAEPDVAAAPAAPPARRRGPFVPGPYGARDAAEGADPVAEPIAAMDAADGAGSGKGAGSGVGAPPSPPSPPAAKPSFEEAIGTRWAVWVGGVALALGGLFLVRYSIEQGLLGPGARTLLGALFALVLLAGGEWLRRREVASPVAGLPAAYVPGVLTAVGILTAFATVWAAYALYGFLPAPVAFGLLAAVAFGAFAAALLHGPALAGLGLIAAHAAPLLVASSDPNRLVFGVYLLAVAAAAFALARLRLWRWLAITAFVAAVAFGFLVELPVHVAGLTALTVWFFVASLHEAAPPHRDEPWDRFATPAMVALLVLALAAIGREHFDLAGRGLAAALAAGAFVAVWRWPALRYALPFAAIFAGFAVLGLDLDLEAAVGAAFAEETVDLTLARPPGLVGFLVKAAAMAAILAGLGVLFARSTARAAPKTAAALVGSGALAAILVLVAAWLRAEGVETSMPFAAAGLLLAFLYALATEAIAAREDETAPLGRLASGFAALGGVAALGTALAIGLEKGALTVALALMIPAIAFVGRVRPYPVFRWLALVVGLVVLGRIAEDPRIVGDALGSTPFFNWITWGYGVPALGTAVAAFAFRRQADDLAVRGLEALAIVFAALFGAMEIRHAFHGETLFTAPFGFAEAGLMTTLGLAFSAALLRLDLRAKSPVFDLASTAASVLALVFGLVTLFLDVNPWWTGEPLAGVPPFDAVLVGFGLPAAAAAGVAWLARDLRPAAYVRTLGIAGLILLLAHATTLVRRVFAGPVVAPDLVPLEDAEMWVISAVWLTIGLALLFAGIFVRSRTVRAASAAVVGITILKVFLVDLGETTGLARAGSFIGLGFTLILIGLVYQRLLFPQRRDAGPGTGTGE